MGAAVCAVWTDEAVVHARRENAGMWSGEVNLPKVVILCLVLGLPPRMTLDLLWARHYILGTRMWNTMGSCDEFGTSCIAIFDCLSI